MTELREKNETSQFSLLLKNGLDPKTQNIKPNAREILDNEMTIEQLNYYGVTSDDIIHSDCFNQMNQKEQTKLFRKLLKLKVKKVAVSDVIDYELININSPLYRLNNINKYKSIEILENNNNELLVEFDINGINHSSYLHSGQKAKYELEEKNTYSISFLSENGITLKCAVRKNEVIVDETKTIKTTGGYINEDIRKTVDNLIQTHCLKMGVFKEEDEESKKIQIIDSISQAFNSSKLTIVDLVDFLDLCNKDKVINHRFFLSTSNLFYNKMDNQKFNNFVEELFLKTPTLGTPHSATGKGELVTLFCSPKYTKLVKGDLLYNNKTKIELRSGDYNVDTLKISINKTGAQLNHELLLLVEKYGLTPNKRTKNRSSNGFSEYAVELEKAEHTEHWKKELSKLDIETQKSFVKEWFDTLDDIVKYDYPKSINFIFSDGEFNYDNFKKQLVKHIFRISHESDNFDILALIYDGKRNSKTIHSIDHFNKMINNGIIEIKSNYFRISHSYKCGWYIR